MTFIIKRGSILLKSFNRIIRRLFEAGELLMGKLSELLFSGSAEVHPKTSILSNISTPVGACRLSVTFVGFDKIL